MQDQLYPSHGQGFHAAPGEQQYSPHAASPHSDDSPGKKKSMLGIVKDKAKKLKSKVKKKTTGTDHGNEAEGSDHEAEENGSSSAGGDDNDAEEQMEEENYQKESVDEKGATENVFKGSHTKASADLDAPASRGKLDESEAPTYPSASLEDQFPVATSEVIPGGPYSTSLKEARKVNVSPPSEDLSSITKPAEEDTEESAENPLKAQEPRDSSSLISYSEGKSERERGESLRPPRDQKDDIETRSLKDEPLDREPVFSGEFPSGQQSTEEREGEDISSSLTDETRADAKPQTTIEEAYEGINSAEGSAGSTGAEEMGEEATGYKSYFDIGKEKLLGVKDSVMGSLQDQKEEGIEKSEGSSNVAGKTTSTIRSFKDAIVSKLGYGGKTLGDEGQEVTSSSPVSSEEEPNATGTAEGTLKSLKDTTPNTGTGASSTPEFTSSSPENLQESGEQKPFTQNLYDTVAGVKDAAATKFGYGGEKDKENVNPGTVSSEDASPDKQSYGQKLYDTAAGATGVVASKLGYNQTPSPKTEESKSKSEGRMNQIAARFNPGEEDKALSQLITDAVSNSAATVKDTLLSPFSGRSSNSTSPSSTAATASQQEVAGDDASSNPPVSPTVQSKGIVDRVTGAVSSMLGRKSSGEKNAGPLTAEKLPPEDTTT